MENFEIGHVIISRDPSLLDADTIVRFLRESYWAQDRPEAEIRRSLETSVCYGAYYGRRQVGFARVATDGSEVYWLCDVYVDLAFRARGIGKMLVETVTSSTEFRNKFGLVVTKDAHGLYERFGFVRDHGTTLTRLPDFLRARP